jgi:hypothetical protein
MGFGMSFWADPAEHNGGSLPPRDVQPKLLQASDSCIPIVDRPPP